MINFKYKITQFDATNKLLTVEFSDGGWAQIHLVNPMPTTAEQIDDIVRHYVAPVEVIEARNTDVDLSFISALVGVQREAARIDNRPQAKAQADEVIDSAVADEEEARLTAFVESILISKGLINA